MGREDEIKVIAYYIWKEQGCPDGCDCNHWYQAEAIWLANQKQESKKPEIAQSKEQQPEVKNAEVKTENKTPNLAKQNRARSQKSRTR